MRDVVVGGGGRQLDGGRRHEAFDGVEREHLAGLVLRIRLDVDDDDLAGRERLVEDLLRQDVFDLTLDRTPQRTGTELRVVPDRGEVFLRRLGDLDPETLTLELADSAA